MEYKNSALLKWGAIALGIVCLIGVFLSKDDGRLIPVLISLAFVAAGIAIMVAERRAAKKEADLRQNGRLIQADFQEVEFHTTKSNDDDSSTKWFQLVAQWHDSASNQIFIFRSRNLRFNPTDYVQIQTVPVYVDPADPTRYHMDLSFLPQVRG